MFSHQLSSLVGPPLPVGRGSARGFQGNWGRNARSAKFVVLGGDGSTLRVAAQDVAVDTELQTAMAIQEERPAHGNVDRLPNGQEAATPEADTTAADIGDFPAAGGQGPGPVTDVQRKGESTVFPPVLNMTFGAGLHTGLHKVSYTPVFPKFKIYLSYILRPQIFSTVGANYARS